MGRREGATPWRRGARLLEKRFGLDYGTMAWRQGESAHLGGADPAPLPTLPPIGRDNAYVVVQEFDDDPFPLSLLVTVAAITTPDPCSVRVAHSPAPLIPLTVAIILMTIQIVPAALVRVPRPTYMLTYYVYHRLKTTLKGIHTCREYSLVCL